MAHYSPAAIGASGQKTCFILNKICAYVYSGLIILMCTANEKNVKSVIFL